jgi:MoaA/NifB/PqqE/SkfB family radical SAM enzyme
MNKIIQELLHISHGKGVKTINFYMMGEPLMNVDTPTFIQMARDAKVSEKIILTSNGSLLKGERAKRLAESPPDYLRISIYGPNSSHHREITAFT